MARPRKSPAAQRRHVVNIRLTDGELELLKQLAQDAGLPYGRYARETVLGRRPKSKPAKTLTFQKLLYELQSIATNFQQLADVTEDEAYTRWARYAGGQLVEQLLGRDDLTDLIDRQLAEINVAGQFVNAVARQANSGEDILPTLQQEAFDMVRQVLEPLHEASTKKPMPSSGAQQKRRAPRRKAAPPAKLKKTAKQQSSKKPVQRGRSPRRKTGPSSAD